MLPAAPTILALRDVSARLNCRAHYARALMGRLVLAELADAIHLPDKLTLYRLRRGGKGATRPSTAAASIPQILLATLGILDGGRLSVDSLSERLAAALNGRQPREGMERHVARLQKYDLVRSHTDGLALSSKGQQLLRWVAAANVAAEPGLAIA